MGAVVIHDDVGFQFSGHIDLDQIQELAEFGGAVATVELADHAAGLQFQRRKQRGGPVTLVVMGAPLGLARAHRQERLGTVQRLNLALPSTQKTRA